LKGGAFLLGFVFLASPRPLAASPITELVREAQELEAAREDDRAVSRYTEAIQLDPTCGPAYVGLADLRARRGDTREAERVYSVALEHVPGLRAALVGRARVRRALGETREGDSDLEQYLKDESDLNEIRELAAWYGEEGRTAAQLAAWRRLYVSLAGSSGVESGPSPAVLDEARATIKALQILLGPADPVVSPPGDDAVRRGMARIARRGE
jgi:tetratricopeptide (TPR) repeat protein